MKKILRETGILMLAIAICGILSFPYVTAQAEETDTQQVNMQQEAEGEVAPVGTVFTMEKDILSVSGKKLGKDTYKFKITKSGVDGEGEVELIGFSQKLRDNVWSGTHLEKDTVFDNSGEEYTITSIGDRAFAKYHGSVQIDSEYIERIGDEAFAGCSSVQIGIGKKTVKKGGKIKVVNEYVDNLKAIGRKAFSGIENGVDIYASEIGQIASHVFSDTKGVDIYATKIGQIGSNAFSGAEDVYVKESEIGEIGSKAFFGVKREVTLDIEKVGQVGWGAFQNVKVVNLYGGAIDSRLFKSCNRKLEVRHFGQREEIDDQTFAGCENVKGIYIYVDKNIRFSEKAFKHFRKARNIYIYDTGMKEIRSGMFSECKEVREIEFKCPNITKIADRAFRGCKNLKSLTLVGSRRIKTIGKRIFSGCKKMSWVHMGANEKLKSVKKDAFRGANSKGCIYVYSKKSIALRLKGKGMAIWRKPYIYYSELGRGIVNGDGVIVWKKI